MSNPDFTAEEIKQFKSVFDKIDIKQTGFIDVKEVQKIMRDFGSDITLEDIEAMMSDIDVNKSGNINFEEFLEFLRRSNNDTASTNEEEDEVLRAFQTFDKNGDGHLTCTEFKHILTTLGDKFTEKEVDEIFKEIDINHDGILEYREFIDFWKVK